ncbi:MAG: hypothetical protein R2860_02030 [Desulfobacterales bacterium]
MNDDAVDQTLENLVEITMPESWKNAQGTAAAADEKCRTLWKT